MFETARVIDSDVDLSAKDVDDDSWIQARIPGDLHQTLVRAGRLADPNVALNNLECAWVEQRSWWYRLRFSAPLDLGPDERLLLVCHGLDTVASLWLNGVELGAHATMFRPAVFDVTHRCLADNVLTLRFSPPVAQGQEQWDVRKAQFSFGWDFAARRPSIGIWRPIELVRQRCVAIRGVRFHTLSASESRAEVAVGIDIEDFGDADWDLRIRLFAPDGELVGEMTPSGTLTIENPQLWWTHDLGDQPLYSLHVEVSVDGELVAAEQRRVGIRVIELDQSPDPDEPGSLFFRFVLNGIPISARGANWVPADLAVGEIADSRYARLLGAARDAHMNMIRIWGGGIYEHDAFYDTCDQWGILVWHDFMFAGAGYREDPQFRAEVQAEARYQVDRLTSHPSIALWCGNNEVDMLGDMLGWSEQVRGNSIFYELLPAVLGQVASYVPTSPMRGNARTQGDRHMWRVWHGVDESDLAIPIEDRSIAWWMEPRFVDPASQEAAEFLKLAGPQHYLEDTGRFISEYGMSGAACLETFAHWNSPEGLSLGNPEVAHRFKPGKVGPGNKFDIMLAALAGEPRTLQDYVELSQLMQAEGDKIGAEHYRRRSPHCGGSLLWQLNDCWPAISWALIDYDGRPKAAYYYARRSFAPVLASFAPTADGVELWVTNDTVHPINDELHVRLSTFDGEAQWSESVVVAVPARSSHAVASWSLQGAPHLYLSCRGSSVAPNRHFFATAKDLVRKIEPPTATVEDSDGVVTVTVTATSYCLLVHAVSPDPSMTFSDNYFDLEPGETRLITALGSAAGVEVRSR